MKKHLFFSILILSIIINQAISFSKAEARDYYLGVYENGQTAYLMTETVQYFKEDFADGGDGYTCTVKAVDPNSNEFDYIYYKLLWYQSEILTKNGKSYSLREMQKLYKNPDSVDMKVVLYLRDTFRKQFGDPRPRF